MRSLFVVHASIWDVVALVIAVVFAGAYFVIWAGEARRQRRERKK